MRGGVKNPSEWPPVKARAGETVDEAADTLTTTANGGHPWRRFDDKTVSLGFTSHRRPCGQLSFAVHCVQVWPKTDEEVRGDFKTGPMKGRQGCGQQHAYLLIYVLNEERLRSSHKTAVQLAAKERRAAKAKAKAKAHEKEKAGKSTGASPSPAKRSKKE